MLTVGALAEAAQHRGQAADGKDDGDRGGDEDHAAHERPDDERRPPQHVAAGEEREPGRSSTSAERKSKRDQHRPAAQRQAVAHAILRTAGDHRLPVIAELRRRGM